MSVWCASWLAGHCKQVGQQERLHACFCSLTCRPCQHQWLGGVNIRIASGLEDCVCISKLTAPWRCLPCRYLAKAGTIKNTVKADVRAVKRAESERSAAEVRELRAQLQLQLAQV